ncbi:MAG: HNH endonuclease signature motif containing protein [Thaumarchaeota archaeon]|nr:HNH endonuclease signature motif containing protein [Nitrososphaerota archaeon]
MSSKTTQRDVVLEYYRGHPNRDIEHPEIVDWLTAEYPRRTGRVFRDPDRQIRSLHQQGFLIKVKQGVYRYDPEHADGDRELPEFTPEQKAFILKRDGYKCSVCGKGERDGVTLHVDHVKPKDKGGEATVENGQVLCSEHNFRKKNYNQTEMAKSLFISLHRRSQKVKDEKLIAFTRDILAMYDKHDVNGHIVWED